MKRTHVTVISFYDRKQGPRSKFSSGGAKEECVKENFGGGGLGGGHACGFLFNFS